MFRFLLLLLIFSVPLNAFATAEASSPLSTQRDLITGLVESMGWSFGLPEKPETSDYITILEGRRNYKFEFEEVIIPSAKAPLAPKEIRSFGPFSGKIWQRAPGHEVEAELSFLVPLSGRYEIKAALTRPGYRFRINGEELTADGSRDFAVVTFGEVELKPGQQTARLVIPSRGGIDFLLLEAPPVQAIAPIGGWEPDKPLDHTVLAVVLAQTLELESFLPPLDNKTVIEAEEAPTPKGAICCDDRYKGPIQGEWIKAGISSGNYSHLFEISQAGVYDLHLNILGKSPIDGLLNGRDHFRITPKPYFTTIHAGAFYLDQGVNQIDINLPSRGGLDRFIFRPRASAPEDYLRLAGIADGAAPNLEQLDRLLRLVALIGAER